MQALTPCASYRVTRVDQTWIRTFPDITVYRDHSLLLHFIFDIHAGHPVNGNRQRPWQPREQASNTPDNDAFWNQQPITYESSHQRSSPGSNQLEVNWELSSRVAKHTELKFGILSILQSFTCILTDAMHQ